MDADVFHSSFSDCYNNSKLSDANIVLMNVLGELLVNKRSDFVFLLNESSIEANEAMTDQQLTDLFLENVGKNNKLALGASLFVNMNNKQIGFDGEEKVNDSMVKAGYYTLQDQFSNAGGLLLGALQGIAGLGKSFIDDKHEKQFGAVDMLKQKQAAQAAMQQQILKQRAIQLQAQAKAADAKAKKKRLIIIVGSSVLGLLIIVGTLIYFKRK